MRRSRLDFVPGPVFIAVLGAAALGGWLAWNRVEAGPFVLVLGGWIASIALHEYAHALLAYRWGDRGLRGGGYLSLNPLRFSERFLGAVLPVVYLLLGGFGMTGPASYLAPVGSRAKRCLAALAGPVMSLALAAVIAATVVAVLGGQRTDSWFWASMVYLVYIQCTAALIGLLPIPGLDGFAALAPYLPERAAHLAQRAKVYGPIAVFAVLWFPPVHTVLLDAAFRSFVAVGVNPLLFGLGQEVFSFWSG